MSIWKVQIHQTTILGMALAGVIFQQKIDETFKDLPSVFGTASDILVVGIWFQWQVPWPNPKMSDADYAGNKV